MDARSRFLRVPDNLAATAGFQNYVKPGSTVLDDYVLSETVFLSPDAAVTPDDCAALASKLNVIASQYTQFHRSIAPCALASCHDLAPPSNTAALPRAADASRSPSEGMKSAKSGDGARGKASSKPAATVATTSSGTGSDPPDLESFWLATSPLPPTAVLTALYSILPLHRASVVNRESVDFTAGEGNAENADDEAAGARQSFFSFEIWWTLCRLKESGEKGQRTFSFWEAFAMTAVSVHRATASITYGGSTEPSQGPSSSASSFSLAQQLRRAVTLLNSTRQGSTDAATATAPKAPSLSPATTLLEWPEELLWGLLMSLLSALALVHSAGLHFFGQLTAANVLCLSCASSLPRLLEQTWRDVVATASGQGKDESQDDDAALLRRFFVTASRGVLQPQASLTSETPCHNAFFVVQPSLELLSKKQLDTAKHPDAVDAVPIGEERKGPTPFTAASSTAQEVADETPEQQVCFRAADLASVGRLLTTILDLRARWSREAGARFSSTGTASPPAAAAAPSSELVFLVRRLCECEMAATSPSPQHGCPTALQLLQLQALRLRTETWYYRRLAAEAYDRLSQVQAAPPLPPTQTAVAPAVATARSPETKQHGTATRTAEDERLRARETAVAEREAKLDLILRVYELTHEHLDAVNLPPSQPPSAHENDSSNHAGQRGEAEGENPPYSQTTRDDSLEALLGVPAYRQAATTTATSQAAAPMAVGHRTPPTNVSHQQHGPVSVGVNADTSADALLGLSPLPRLRGAADADATLLSVNATPIASLVDPEQRASSPAVDLQPWRGSTTRRTLDVGTPPDTFAAMQETKEAEGTAATLYSVTQAPIGTMTRGDAMKHGAWHASASVVPLSIAGEAVHAPWDHLQTQPLEPPPAFQQINRSKCEEHRDGGAGATPSKPVTVVEMELDDNSDVEDTTVARPNTASAEASRYWLGRRAIHDESQGPVAAQHDPQLVSSPHPQQAPPQPLFSSPTASSTTTRAAQDLQTPVPAPALPNMGITDVDVSGVSAGGGGSGSHSKYSSLGLLRTPPSARRSHTGNRRVERSPSPSPHSPESYRSSTRPYTTVAPAQAAQRGFLPPPSQQQQQPRSSRHRSASRGSNSHNGTVSSDAAAAAAGTAASGSNGTSGEGGEWARQQLTELQNMQSALRAQQPATPRSRASGSAGATAAGEKELHTPEQQPARSPIFSASLSSPPLVMLRATHSGVSTPPSPFLREATPMRDAATQADRSPVGTDNNRRAGRSSHPLHPVQQDSSFHAAHPYGDARQSEERPAQVQGTSWSATNAMKTPSSNRQQPDETWSSSATVSSPAPRPAPTLSGRTTPPSKPTHPTSKRCTDNSSGSGPARRDAQPAVGSHSSTTVAALEAALRTPPRQTVPSAAVLDASERRRLGQLLYTSPASTDASTKKSDAAAPTAHSTLSGRRPAASVNERVRAPVRGSVSHATDAGATATAATPLGVGAKEVSPRRSNGGVGGGSGHLNSARGHSARSGSGGLPRTVPAGAAVLRQSGADALPSSSASSRVTASQTTGLTPASTSAAGKAPAVQRGGSTSAMELLRRLRASSAATV